MVGPLPLALRSATRASHSSSNAIDDRVRFRRVADARRGEQSLDLVVVDGGFGLQLLLEGVGATRQAVQAIDQLVASGEARLAARHAAPRADSDRPRLRPRVATELADDHRAAHDLGSAFGIRERAGNLEDAAADLGGSR